MDTRLETKGGITITEADISVALSVLRGQSLDTSMDDLLEKFYSYIKRGRATFEKDEHGTRWNFWKHEVPDQGLQFIVIEVDGEREEFMRTARDVHTTPEAPSQPDVQENCDNCQVRDICKIHGWHTSEGPRISAGELGLRCNLYLKEERR